jgi:hypothetical protein
VGINSVRREFAEGLFRGASFSCGDLGSWTADAPKPWSGANRRRTGRRARRLIALNNPLRYIDPAGRQAGDCVGEFDGRFESAYGKASPRFGSSGLVNRPVWLWYRALACRSSPNESSGCVRTWRACPRCGCLRRMRRRRRTGAGGRRTGAQRGRWDLDRTAGRLAPAGAPPRWRGQRLPQWFCC